MSAYLRMPAKVREAWELGLLWMHLIAKSLIAELSGKHLHIQGSCVWQWGWHGLVWQPAASAVPPTGETFPPLLCHPRRWAHHLTAGGHPHLLPRISLCALCRSGKGKHTITKAKQTFVKSSMFFKQTNGNKLSLINNNNVKWCIMNW